jgi:crotonobetainyl-CoA:carnitine CoA-transferase CaiB-like acyl-CoA transferase
VLVAMMTQRSNAGGMLSAYRVFDLTDEKGMFCTRLLADMGAEVIRIENQTQETHDSASCCYFNAGKKKVKLDLATEPGGEEFRRMVKTADVVVEDQAPACFEKLGLGYAALSEINSRLVMASITDFGQSGPYRDYKSCDLVAVALGGQMYVCGSSQSPPLKPFGSHAYLTASLFAANGILLALWQRHTTGMGQHIDVSVMECAAAALDHVLVRYFYDGTVAKRQGSLHWNNAFRIFPCRDGYVLLSLFQHWETLVEWLDAEGLAGDLTGVRYRNREERVRCLDHIIEVLERWTRNHGVDELVEKGQMMHFPWAKVASIPELVASPQMAARNFFVAAEDPETGSKVRYPGTPWQVRG